MKDRNTAVANVAVDGTSFGVLPNNTTVGGATVDPIVNFNLQSSQATDTETIARIDFIGKDSTAEDTSYARIATYISDNTNSTEDGILRFRTMQGGSLDEVFLMGRGCWHPLAGGADRGAGTLNFENVYDNGTLLTCYGFDAYFNPPQDEAAWKAEWDGRVANIDYVDPTTKQRVFRERKHTGVEEFLELRKTTDLYDWSALWSHFQTKQHLPMLKGKEGYDPLADQMPIGKVSSALTLNMELVFIHIAKLHDEIAQLKQRLNALEAAKP